MQISPINKSYAPSFGEIFSKGESTEKQSELINELKNQLREPNENLNNKTPEEYYGKKQYSFVIETLPDNAVALFLEKNLRTIGAGTNREYTYSEAIKVGEYDSEHKLDINDIKTAHKEDRNTKNLLMAILGFATAAMLFAGISQCKGAKSAALESAGKAGETIDSIYNKFTNVVLK